MDIKQLAQKLEFVRWRGADRFTARCPSHDDRNPSLSIKEGDKALLLRCWSGCPLEEICRALGIEVKDLFFNQLQSLGERKAAPPPLQRYDWRRYSSKLQFASENHWLRAKTIFSTARHLDSKDWDREETWRCLALAFRSLRIARIFENAAFLVRQRGLQREAQAEMRRKAA